MRAKVRVGVGTRAKVHVSFNTVSPWCVCVCVCVCGRAGGCVGSWVGGGVGVRRRVCLRDTISDEHLHPHPYS